MGTLVLAATTAHAATVTVPFSGTVLGLNDGGSALFASSFAVGQAVSGSWTFDTAAVGTPSGAPTNVTSYEATFHATIGPFSFVGTGEYRIFDDHPDVGDGLSFVAENAHTYSVPGALAPLTSTTFFVQHVGMPTSALSSQALVIDPSAIAGLANPASAPHGMRLDAPDGSWGGLYFSAALGPSTVPEPATVWLLLGGVVAAGAMRKRATCAAA